MPAYSIKRVQKIPISPEEAWEFFSNPLNLQVITPGDMRFQIISKHHGDKIYAGQLIEYRIKPFLGIPFYWMTEIAQVKDKEYFIDVQLHGPYKLWHHRHYFKKIPGGVEMTDLIHYKNRMWILGRIANALFVRKKLEKIFDYRYKRIEELFGQWTSNS